MMDLGILGRALEEAALDQDLEGWAQVGACCEQVGAGLNDLWKRFPAPRSPLR